MRRIQTISRKGSNFSIHLPYGIAAEMGIRAGSEIVVWTIGDTLVVQSLENELRMKGAAVARTLTDNGVKVRA